MKPIPFPTGKNTDVPEVSRDNVSVPAKTSREDIVIPKESNFTKSAPVEPEMKKEAPSQPELTRETPTETDLTKEVPTGTELKKEVPPTLKPENCIEVDGEVREIKPTKLKYFRNKMAGVHTVLKNIPLNEFLTYDKGILDPERDADQILYDYLVAVFDDPQFVHDHYENMTAEDVEKAINIFGRLNHVDEKEEKARKNKEAQAKP